jgi:MFS family permease
MFIKIILMSKPTQNKAKRLTIVLAGINIFCYVFGFYLIISMLPIILRENLFLPAFVITFLYFLRYIAGAIYDGFLLDLTKRIGVKASLMIGISGLIGVFTCFYFFRNFYAYVVLFLFLGIFSGLTELKMVEKSERLGAKGIETYYLAFAAGLFAAFISSGYLLTYSLELLMVCAIAMFIVPLIIVSLTSHHQDEKIPLKKLLVKNDFVKEELNTLSYMKKQMKYIFSLKFVSEGFNSMKNLYVPLIVTQVFMQSKMQVSIVLALALIPSIIIEKNLHWVLKKIPPFFFLGGHKRRVLGFSLFFLIMASILIPFTTNVWALAILLIIGSVGYSLILPMLNLVLLKHHPHELDEGSALLYMSTQMGKVILTLVAMVIVFFTQSVLNVFFMPAALFVILFIYLLIDSRKSGKLEVKKELYPKIR